MSRYIKAGPRHIANSFYVGSAGGDGGAGAQTNSWPVTAPTLPTAPAPTMKLAGNPITGTQSVIVGQQIALSASVSLPACMSLSGQQWTPSSSGTPGTPIGGYSASSTSGSVKPLPAKTNSTYTLVLGLSRELSQCDLSGHHVPLRDSLSQLRSVARQQK